MGAIVNAIWQKIQNAISWVIMLLPESPFAAVSNSGVSDLLDSLNWVLPISEALAILEAWTVAITVFYVYQAVLRWVKAIE